MATKGKDSDRENKGSNKPKKDSGAHRRQKSGGNKSKSWWLRKNNEYEIWMLGL